MITYGIYITCGILCVNNWTFFRKYLVGLKGWFRLDIDELEEILYL